VAGYKLNMLGAAKIWLEQANILFERVGDVNPVVVPMVLGDPLYLDDTDKFIAIQQANYMPQLVLADMSMAPGILFFAPTWISLEPPYTRCVSSRIS